MNENIGQRLAPVEEHITTVEERIANAEQRLATGRASLIRRTGCEVPGSAAREYSHDDGAHAGLFLGGIGAPVFSRDMDGRFGRWHLEPGVHVRFPMSEARLLLAWKGTGRAGHPAQGCVTLDARAVDQGFAREATALFPVLWESYTHQDLPFRVLVESFSPLIPGDEQAASLPVAFLQVHIETGAELDGRLEVAAALFWPNLLGWSAGLVSSVDRGGEPWPGQYSAGNSCLPALDLAGNALIVLQTRNADRPVLHSLEGEIALFVSAGEGALLSHEACFKAGQNRIDLPAEEQIHTTAWAEAAFARTLRLPQTDICWEAHWDETLGSAVAACQDMAGGQSRTFVFGLGMDCPVTTFGRGRKWHTKYTEWMGSSGRSAQALAAYALQNREAWLNSIHLWQKNFLEAHGETLGREVAAAQINELYFVNGGGSTWVSQAVPNSDLPVPRLGAGEHFAFLEGFDVGYHYYNTTDLWVYAFPALSRTWPRLADLVFRDLLASVPVEMPAQRMIYREGELRPLMIRGKVPHDLGAPPSDPWHDLNGYQMRDDSNGWLDHTPTLLISYYLHCRMTGTTPDSEQRQSIRLAYEFMRSQAEEDGLPRHRAFGDSTWDNLGLRGVCASTSSAVLAACAAVRAWARDFGDVELERLAAEQLETGLKTFERELWTGYYYRACTEGNYKDCLMSDALMWFMYSDKAGLGALLPIDRIRCHMEAVDRYNYKRHGFHGPLLICEPARGSFPPDGGDIGLQVNEVLVGAAWACCATMLHFGLDDMAREVAQDMARYQHESSTLQFRSPAAWDSGGHFRAPLNMRPLSIWLLDWE